VTLSRQLSWSHFRAFATQSEFQGEFYAEMCRIEGRSARRSASYDRLGQRSRVDGRKS
jgi:hypothetical protein